MVKVGRRPRSVAFLPDSSRAHVSAENDATITVVETVKHDAIQTISLGERGVIKPMSVLLSPDGATQSYFLPDTRADSSLSLASLGCTRPCMSNSGQQHESTG
jgi:DNA-binding beta-propeller fold protein YncE